MMWERFGWATILAIMLVITACGAPTDAPTPGVTATPGPGVTATATLLSTPTPVPTSSVNLSIPELKYRLIAQYGDVFFCDPDYYPIGRPGQEEINAEEQFASIRSDSAEFAAILAVLNLPDKADYTAEEKLAIYREHKKLSRAVEMTALAGGFSYVLRVGEGQGERVEGSISGSGAIIETKREPSVNTCPICLAKGMLIDTPDGQLTVETLREGMTVWSLDAAGLRVEASILRTSKTDVPATFQIVRLSLDDGRTVFVSPGHPTADGRRIGDYIAGDLLDGSAVVSADRVSYSEGATYDILPSGETGAYWANGIPLKSTLSR